MVHEDHIVGLRRNVLHPGEDLSPQHRVLLHDGDLFFREASRFLDDFLRGTNLPDVVEQSSEPHAAQLIPREALVRRVGEAQNADIH